MIMRERFPSEITDAAEIVTCGKAWNACAKVSHVRRNHASHATLKVRNLG